MSDGSRMQCHHLPSPRHPSFSLLLCFPSFDDSGELEARPAPIDPVHALLRLLQSILADTVQSARGRGGLGSNAAGRWALEECTTPMIQALVCLDTLAPPGRRARVSPSVLAPTCASAARVLAGELEAEEEEEAVRASSEDLQSLLSHRLDAVSAWANGVSTPTSTAVPQVPLRASQPTQPESVRSSWIKYVGHVVVVACVCEGRGYGTCVWRSPVFRCWPPPLPVCPGLRSPTPGQSALAAVLQLGCIAANSLPVIVGHGDARCRCVAHVLCCVQHGVCVCV